MARVAALTTQLGAGNQDILEAEARALARYLVRGEISPTQLALYSAASTRLLAASPPRSEAAVAAFARRNIWALPFLDASCAWLQPDGLLRSRILIMCAILEASPDFVEHFLPRATPRSKLLPSLAVLGVQAALRTAVGLLIHPIAVRSRP